MLWVDYKCEFLSGKGLIFFILKQKEKPPASADGISLGRRCRGGINRKKDLGRTSRDWLDFTICVSWFGMLASNAGLDAQTFHLLFSELR